MPLGARRLAFAILFALVFLGLVLSPRRAQAETLEAPVGGAPVLFGDGRVACSKIAAGWTVELGARSARPPSAPAQVGAIGELHVARSAAECAGATATVRLVATAAWPDPEGAAFT